ncbi:uncharacterized protein LOC120347664 [Styela clava]
MRVSFGPTSELGPMINGREKGAENHIGHEDGETEEGMSGEEQLLRQLKKEREEASKREEALRDRLTLHETISSKQIQELKNQLKNLQQNESSQKGLSRHRDSISSSGTSRSERKRDGKFKDIREMQKTIGYLKAENEELQERLEKLTDFVKIAGDMKNQAINQISSKDTIIQGLRREIHAMEKLFDEESRRRIQVEGELHSLRTYVDHIGHKSKEKMKHRVVQTEIMIPPKFIIGARGTGSVVGFSSSNSTSFANLSAAAASWRLRHLEKEYQEESRKSKQKFHEAANIHYQRTPPRSRVNPQRHSVSEFPRQNSSSVSSNNANFPPEEMSSRGSSATTTSRLQRDRPSIRASYASSHNKDSHKKRHNTFSESTDTTEISQ